MTEQLFMHLTWPAGVTTINATKRVPEGIWVRGCGLLSTLIEQQQVDAVWMIPLTPELVKAMHILAGLGEYVSIEGYSRGEEVFQASQKVHDALKSYQVLV